MQNRTIKKSLILFIIFLFVGINISPCITSNEIKNTNFTNIINQYKEEKYVEVTSRFFTSNKIDEIKNNVTIEDLQLLDMLYKNDIEGFVEKLDELNLLGNKTVEDTMYFLNDKSGDKTILFSDETTNKNCFFKFFGDIFSIYYLPIPYILYQFIENYGIILGILLLGPLLYLFLILYEIFPNFIEKLLDNLVNFLTKFESFIERIVKLSVNIEKILGWIHCWSPIKLPIRNTVITSGNLHLETSGKFGTWNKTATMSLILMGFRGLWISLPPLSTPPFTPTWCIGYAKYLVTE